MRAFYSFLAFFLVFYRARKNTFETQEISPRIITKLFNKIYLFLVLVIDQFHASLIPLTLIMAVIQTTIFVLKWFHTVLISCECHIETFFNTENSLIKAMEVRTPPLNALRIKRRRRTAEQVSMYI